MFNDLLDNSSWLLHYHKQPMHALVRVYVGPLLPTISPCKWKVARRLVRPIKNLATTGRWPCVCLAPQLLEPEVSLSRLLDTTLLRTTDGIGGRRDPGLSVALPKADDSMQWVSGCLLSSAIYIAVTHRFVNV